MTHTANSRSKSNTRASECNKNIYCKFVIACASLWCMVLSALAPAGGYQSSWGTLVVVLGDEAGCGARHVDPRPSGIGLSARRPIADLRACLEAAGDRRIDEARAANAADRARLAGERLRRAGLDDSA
jgi:hypothetical protein